MAAFVFTAATLHESDGVLPPDDGSGIFPPRKSEFQLARSEGAETQTRLFQRNCLYCCNERSSLPQIANAAAAILRIRMRTNDWVEASNRSALFSLSVLSWIDIFYTDRIYLARFFSRYTHWGVRQLLHLARLKLVNINWLEKQMIDISLRIKHLLFVVCWTIFFNANIWWIFFHKIFSSR